MRELATFAAACGVPAAGLALVLAWGGSDPTSLAAARPASAALPSAAVPRLGAGESLAPATPRAVAAAPHSARPVASNPVSSRPGR